MRRPGWLQELDAVLSLMTYEARQAALEAWEARWVVPVQTRVVLSEWEMMESRSDVVSMGSRHIQDQVGQKLAQLMGVLHIHEHHAFGRGLEVRGEAWALRREPHADGDR